jgi:putative transposase
MQEDIVMPRAPRKKDPTAIYHVMSHSITEFDLFTDNADKEYFLNLLQKYNAKHNCKIYGYCLMTNHYHIILDTCGFDISKYMKSLNQSYARHINNTYKRKGSLLAERFKSKIIDSDKYLMTVSAYVHNNPKDLPGYNGREFEYPYSSMGIYLGKVKDRRNLVDTDYILGCVNEIDRDKAIKAYSEIVIEKRDIGINSKLREYLEAFEKEQYEYRSYRKVILRDKKPEDVIKLIAEKLGIEDINILMHRWKRNALQFRQITAYALNNFCGLSINEITKQMHNISHSCCAMLSNKGYEALRANNHLRECLIGNF